MELAAAFAVFGSIVAVVSAAFAKNLHFARHAEAVNGLNAIADASIAYAELHGGAFPPSAPMTPAVPPRGDEGDAPGLWDHVTWQALNFKPVPDGEAHTFSFAYDNQGLGFKARAHQDRNHDGVWSTFELSGRWTGTQVIVDRHILSSMELE